MKILKKIVCITLSVILVFMCSTASFASDSTNSITQSHVDTEYPLIIIPGIKFDKQYLDINTENERGYISNITVNSVLGALGKATVDSLFSSNKDAFADDIISYCSDAFKYVSCDKNGNSTYNVSARKYPLAVSNYSYDELPQGSYNEEGILATAVQRYGADMVYYYSYDWRTDPLDNSDEINALINQAKQDHHCDKVNIVSGSLGGINTVAYLYEYGSQSVNNCVFLSSTFCGTYIASDILQGKISFSGEGVYNYLCNFTKNSAVIACGLKILYKTGFFNSLCNSINGAFNNYSQKIYDNCIRDTFSTIPVLWSIVLPDEYDDCINYIFYNDELKSEYSGLIERADKLQEMVNSRDEVLKKACENGMTVSVVAGYNSGLTPVNDRSNTQGDGTLETALMAGRATVANLGKTLPDDYVAKNPSKLSPDRVIDMSETLFPDSTWLVKDAPHVACLCGSQYSEFVFTLIDYKGQPTVDTLKGYKQFMKVDNSQNFIDFK
jgi:hypothetical protein